jgi:uncharacterized protein (DUF302 family)
MEVKVMIKYGFTRDLALPYEKAVKLVREALQKEGFGILTEIDVKEKLKEKLGVDFKKYVILGACNPPYAYSAIRVEEGIGLLLPCNVVVYENNGGSVLSIIRPTVAMEMIDNPELKKIASEVEIKLRRVFDTVQ